MGVQRCSIVIRSHVLLRDKEDFDNVNATNPVVQAVDKLHLPEWTPTRELTNWRYTQRIPHGA